MLAVQILIVVVLARACGAFARGLGQPTVIGEIAAGILLGPSLFGAVAPGLFRTVFAPESLTGLYVLSHGGLLIYMFAVGLEFNWGDVRRQTGTALAVSAASIAVPFALGLLVAIPLTQNHAPDGIAFGAFAPFLGVAMSITAFPVLARILDERGLSKTPLGSTAIGAAAAGDLVAWTMLAYIVAIVTSAGTVTTLVTAATWAVTFGAFLAGAVAPARAMLRHAYETWVEPAASVVLLPLFFAYTGLRTEIGLLDTPSAWVMCLAIIALATIGKLGAGAMTARIAGMPWRDAFVLGALMNTRGLMELVALNIGFDLGVISPEIFAVLVIMALVTTAMTGPLIDIARSEEVRR